MDRRQYLAAFAAAVSGGCAAPGTTGGSDEPTTANAAEYPMPDDLPVPGAELERGALRDAIPAITDPAFGADWSGVAVEVNDEFGEYTATPRLADGDRLVGVERDGRARAYPLRVLVWHEVVNDAFGGPLLVTYCPICRSGVVAERVVDGEPTAFSVTGLLWQPPGVRAAARNQSGDAFGASSDDPDASLRNSGNLVMRDEATGSYWSQLLARAICGPRTGDELAIRASTVATWGEWRASHSTTDVLVPPPDSGTL
ncbi:DUF3179 domain-containing (seleno)protein [Halomicrococcus sp. SG-WS-1]|uniref:DUF3179 domain-containing (seleno)protein n=1 Tax=Halomicrococcus sp. SG-WS-1 TaxID=3439057 RepID=UPI003F78D626